MKKKCSKCRKTLDIKNFSKNASATGGHDHYCKNCNKKRLHKYFASPKGKAAMQRASRKRRKK